MNLKSTDRLTVDNGMHKLKQGHRKAGVFGYSSPYGSSMISLVVHYIFTFYKVES